MDLVKITNTGSDPVLFNGNEKIKLEAGKSRIVPWEFACIWLGRPDIDDPVERKVAYDHARHTWGYMDGVHTPETWVDGGGLTPEGTKMSQKPTVRVDTLPDSDGDSHEVVMLIDDPDRDVTFGGVGDEPLPTDTSDVTVLRAAMARQQAEMDNLKALVAGLTQNPTPELDPQTATSLATVESADAASQPGAGELPAPKPTKKGASDGPLTVK